MGCARQDSNLRPSVPQSPPKQAQGLDLPDVGVYAHSGGQSRGVEGAGDVGGSVGHIAFPAKL
jgi:hypothetical protein